MLSEAPGRETLFEFPTMAYPYSSQNSRGRVPDLGEGAAGFTRTITNRQREIRGVVYHPYITTGQSNQFVKAEEIYTPRQGMC